VATAVTARRILAIRIEGIGDASAATATNKLTRWVTDRSLLDDAATADPDNLYANGLYLFPNELGFTADFRTGTAGAGTQSFELRGHSTLWEKVFRYSHPVVAKLITTAISKTTASVTLDTAGLTGTIYLEREAILLGAESPTKTYACTRGVLGTTATAHGVDNDDDTECFSTMHVLAGRFVEYIAIDMGTSSAYGSETQLWAGVVRKVVAPSPDTIRIEADSALSLVRGAKLMREQYRGTVTNFQRSQLGQVVFNEIRIEPDLDKPNATRPDAGYTDNRRNIIGTKDGAVIVDHVLLDAALKTARCVVRDSTVAGFGRSPAPEWKGGDDAWEILSSATGSPPNSASPAANTLPLASNPAVLLLQLLLSTDNGGSPGDNHATYDTGIANLAGGIPAALVDVAQIEAWGVRFFGSSAKNTGHLDSFHLGVDGKPEDLAESVSRILRAYGAMLVQGRGGQLAVASFADALPWGGTNAISEGQILYPPPISQDSRIEDAVDRLEMTYAAWPGREPDVLNVEDAINRRRQPPGWSSSLTFDLGAMTSLERARRIAEQFVIRFHDPIPLIQLETLRTADYWPGDVVTVSHQYLFGPSATRGVTGAVMLVVDRTEALNADGHSIAYGLLYVGALIGSTSYIAPSAVVASWSSPVLTLESNVYTLPTVRHGPFRLDVPNDSAAFNPWEVGDNVQLCDQYGTVRVAKVGVDAVGASTLTLATADLGATVPAATDIVRVSKYGNSAARQRALWVYVADATDLLDGDAPKDYVTAAAPEES